MIIALKNMASPTALHRLEERVTFRNRLRARVHGSRDQSNAASAASLGTINFKDPRTIVPGAPIAIYGGVKLKF